MKKNMKKIIHVSCLVSLLFTCNQTIGEKNKLVLPFRKKFNSLLPQKLKQWLNRKKQTGSSLPQTFIPNLDVDAIFSLDEASIKLENLIEQRKQGQGINIQTCDIITNILFSYAIESEIKIINENNNKVIGVCDIRGWKKNKDIKGKIGKRMLAIYKTVNILKKLPKFDKNNKHIEIYKTSGWKIGKVKKQRVATTRKKLALQEPN